MNLNSLWKKLVKKPSKLISTFSLLTVFVPTPALFALETDEQTSTYHLIIDDIVCRGNEDTDCDFITKKYFQKVGDIVDPGEIADARLRLGTLQQFRDIRIILEKGRERGHVKVVFIVDEANQIQYNITTNFLSRDTQDLDTDRFGLSTGITNFNFLGKGKHLSLGINVSKSQLEQVLPDNFNILTGEFNSSYESDTSDQSISLSYYDPHLLDSKKYYLQTFISYLSSEQTSKSQFNYSDSFSETRIKSDQDRLDYGITLGRSICQQFICRA